MCWTYVIYSDSLDRFYIGSTKERVEERISWHNSQTFGSKSFTARASDWQLYFAIEGDTISLCRAMERHLKRMKSRDYLQRLKMDAARQRALKDRMASLKH
jgi:putative endonuclease